MATILLYEMLEITALFTLQKTREKTFIVAMILVFEQREITASFPLQRARENSDCPGNNVAVSTAGEHRIDFPEQSYNEFIYGPMNIFFYIISCILQYTFSVD